MAGVNPIRYRGYYYDVETQMYYLQSRYYSPKLHRFISADVYMDTGDGIMGTNLYVYCLNNPVNLCDPSGQAPIPGWSPLSPPPPTFSIYDMVPKPKLNEVTKKPIDPEWTTLPLTAIDLAPSIIEILAINQIAKGSGDFFETTARIGARTKFGGAAGIMSNAGTIVGPAGQVVTQAAEILGPTTAVISTLFNILDDYDEYSDSPSHLAGAIVTSVGSGAVTIGGGALIAAIAPGPGWIIGGTLILAGGVFLAEKGIKTLIQNSYKNK